MKIYGPKLLAVLASGGSSLCLVRLAKQHNIAVF